MSCRLKYKMVTGGSQYLVGDGYLEKDKEEVVRHDPWAEW